MTFALILDVLVAVLLVVTIAYAVVLNKRLSRLRQDKQELEGLAATFGQATGRAQDSIGRLKASTDELQMAVDKAEALKEDLAFLLDRGGSAADRLEDLVRRTRKEKEGVAPAPRASGENGASALMAAARREAGVHGPQDDEDPRATARSEAERELLKALQSAR